MSRTSRSQPEAVVQLQSVAGREALLLASYATHSASTAGREHPEPPHAYRGPYQRDRDRIVHSSAYRRLSHKTQVFAGQRGDYHRSRLTHTLEVASIARTIGRALRLNEDLIEALALLHDIGHPPFGHAGEDTLAMCLADCGGFDHNVQALRIAQHLERRYHGFAGLNLSREVLAGQQWRCDKGSATASPPLEVQVVDAADSVAYDAHDADDALELGLLASDALADIPLWREATERVRDRQSEIAGKPLRRAVVHELIDWQVADLLEQLQRGITEHQVTSIERVRAAPLLAVHSAPLAELVAQLETFLYDNVYRHAQVLAMRQQAQQTLSEMFGWYVDHLDALPEGFRERVDEFGPQRTVGDYLAGMTDRYVFQEYEHMAGDRT